MAKLAPREYTGGQVRRPARQFIGAYMAIGTDNTAGPLELRDVPCDFCGSAEADLVMTGRDRFCGLPGEFRVVACRRCGLTRTNPQPTIATIGAAYPEGYTLHREELRPAGEPAGLVRWALVNLRGYPLGRRSPAPLRWLLWPRAALALRNRRNVGYLAYEGGGRLLDYGCGIGKYVAEMAAAGWRAEGMDLVPQAVAAGRAAGLDLRVGTMPGTAIESERYDLVTMWHVLEHVPSPRATLEAIRGILRPGGRVALVCPLSDSLAARLFGPAWYGLDLPRHLTHFTRATLRRHLEAAGLAVERERCIRRPTFFTRSYGYLSEDTGRPLHRRLARSHFAARLASHLALAAGRTDEALFVARRA